MAQTQRLCQAGYGATVAQILLYTFKEAIIIIKANYNPH